MLLNQCFMDSGIRLFRVVYLTVVTILFCTFFFSCQREDLQDDVSEEEKDFFDGPHEGASLNTVLSQEEEVIQLLPSDEDTCPLTIYTEEQLLQLDSIALDLFEGEDAPTRASVAVNRVNSLSGYIVESIAWDSGDWGATHWAGNKIKCGYNARYVQNKKVITIVLWRDGGFQAGKAFLKLGTLNSGPILCSVAVSAGQQYITMEYNIDSNPVINGNSDQVVKLLPGYGFLNLFPLIVYTNGYREYVNPISVKSDPILPDGWNSTSNKLGYLFGTINGVELHHNGASVSSKTGKQRYNISYDGEYQCVNLCKRYLTTQFDLKRTVKHSWGNACDWPRNRAIDQLDKYIVLENNGSNRAREGDMIVFAYDNVNDYPYGHIGVIIKTMNDEKDNYISFANQNAGITDRPIGTTIFRDGDYVSKSRGRSTTYFIRKDNINEHPNGVEYEAPDVNETISIEIAKETLYFGPVRVGDHRVEKLTIKNSGTGPLVISSISLPVGYRCRNNSVAIQSGDELTIPIRFEPASEGVYDGECVLRTNNGSRTVHLQGSGIISLVSESEAIDLGLPSGTKWAPFNVGASRPQEYGVYYAWAETVEKDYYGSGSSLYRDMSDEMPEDIAGTDYDVAHILWGGNWVMPSRKQFEELAQYCTSEWTPRNGILGREFTGPNGSTVFFPAGGLNSDHYPNLVGTWGRYWTSTKYSVFGVASYFGFDDENVKTSSGGGFGYGMNVRPVISLNE